MNLTTLLTRTTPTKTVVLLVYALTLVTTFVLLVNVLGLAWMWALPGLLLALPALVALRYESPWLGIVRTTSLIGLLVIVSGATADLWAQMLSQQRVDASLHLLVLLLGVLLAIAHHLLQTLEQVSAEESNRVSVLLEAGLRGPPIVPALCLALVLGGAILAYIHATESGPLTTIAPMLLNRGVIPPITLNLFLWGMALLFGKWLLTVRELKRADSGYNDSHNDSRGHSNFNAAYQSGNQQGYTQDEFAAALWQQFEAFYTLPRYIGWAIPILGFIGTVLGISLATEELGELFNSSDMDFSQVIQPLGITFDTTLVALSLALVFALCQTLLYRWEERQLLRLTEELRRDVG
ncbi:MAG: MotA/TolQ/ExbB proton channel family protein [Pseudohongiellaceae bacterium]